MSERPPPLRELVLCSLSAPDWVAHMPRLDCQHEGPHLIAACGAFAPAPASSPAVEELRQRLEQIQARVYRATPGPWAWESIAEKSNEFAVGQAWDADGNPQRGRLPEGEWVEDSVIERRTLVGMNESGHANFGDADFIAHAREDVPFLLDQLAALSQSAAALRAQLDATVNDASAKAMADALRAGDLRARAESAEAQLAALQQAQAEQLGALVLALVDLEEAAWLRSWSKLKAAREAVRLASGIQLTGNVAAALSPTRRGEEMP